MLVLRYHPYEQIESVVEGSTPSTSLGGTFINLPFLSSVRNGYDWYEQMSFDRQRYDVTLTRVVTKDHIPDQGVVKDIHVHNRLSFMGINNPSPNQVSICKEELELHRRGINATITAWLKTFIVYCANNVGLKYPERDITQWTEYMDWVEKHLKNYDDAMKVIKSLYISFDYTTDYRHYITCACLMEYNLSIVRDGDGHVTRNFVEKIVSHRLNLLRKQVNLASIKHTGYGFRLIRPRRSTSENTNSLERARPCYFLDWMLTYEKPLVEIVKKGRPNQVVRRNLTTYNKNKKRTTKEILDDIAACDAERQTYILELQELRVSNDLDITPYENDQIGRRKTTNNSFFLYNEYNSTN
jgi:hypothetical protein